MVTNYKPIGGGPLAPKGHRFAEMVVHTSGLTFRTRCECGYLSAPTRVSKFPDSEAQMRIVEIEYAAHLTVISWQQNSIVKDTA